MSTVNPSLLRPLPLLQISKPPKTSVRYQLFENAWLVPPVLMSSAAFFTASSKKSFRLPEKLLIVLFATYEMTGRLGSSVPATCRARGPRHTSKAWPPMVAERVLLALPIGTLPVVGLYSQTIRRPDMPSL